MSPFCFLPRERSPRASFRLFPHGTRDAARGTICGHKSGAKNHFTSAALLRDIVSSGPPPTPVIY
jgi:hypothetical protein